MNLRLLFQLNSKVFKSYSFGINNSLIAELKSIGNELSKCVLISSILEFASNSEFFKTELQETINPVLHQQLNIISSFNSQICFIHFIAVSWSTS